MNETLDLDWLAVPSADALAYARLVRRFRKAQEAVDAAPSRQVRRRAERELEDAADELRVEAYRLQQIGRPADTRGPSQSSGPASV
jgi:hypothetical protein